MFWLSRARPCSASHYGRMEHKIIFELLFDFIPNFCYSAGSARFTRTPITFAEQVERSPPPKTSVNLMSVGNPSLLDAPCPKVLSRRSRSLAECCSHR